MNPARLSDKELGKIADAVETLRLAAIIGPAYPLSHESIREAVNTLDNADLFAEIDAEYHDRNAYYIGE